MAHSDAFTLDDLEDPMDNTGTQLPTPPALPPPIQQTIRLEPPSLPPTKAVQPSPPRAAPIPGPSTAAQRPAATTSVSIAARTTQGRGVTQGGPLPEMKTLAEALDHLQANQDEIVQAEAALQALLQRQSMLLQVERALEQAKVLSVLQQHLPFHKSRPVAALLVHRCCLQWKAFESDHAPVLEQLAGVLQTATDEEAVSARAGGDPLGITAEFAYWLSVTSVLLALSSRFATPRAGSIDAKPSSSSTSTAVVSAKVMQIQKQVASSFSAFGANLTHRWKQAQATASTNSATTPAKALAFGFASLLQPATSTASTAAPPAAAAPINSGEAATRASSGSGQDKAAASAGAAAAVTTTPHIEEQSVPPPLTEVAARSMSGSGSLSQDSTLGSASSLTASQSGPLPATAFMHHLDQAVQKTYGQLRDNLKRQLSGLLPACIQAPADASADQFTVEDSSQGGDVGSNPAQERMLLLLRPWCELVGLLNQHLQALREAHTPRILIKCVFKQVLSFIDAQLFNQLLLRPDCCCASNAAYLVAGLRRLDSWLTNGTEEYLTVLYKDLKHIRQAAQFLVHPRKASLGLQDLATMCPSLNVQQLYRLATTYHNDDHRAPSAAHSGSSRTNSSPGSPESTALSAGAAANVLSDEPDTGVATAAATSQQADSISGEVLEAMKGHNVSNNGGLIVTFLLDEDMVALIAQRGTVSPEVLRLIDAPELYEGFPVPEVLSGSDCPAEVFGFVTQPTPVPHLLAAQ